MDFRTYIKDDRHSAALNRVDYKDFECKDFVMMCLDGEKLLDLCELYPHTAKNVKFRSLDRRMYYLKNQQIQ